MFDGNIEKKKVFTSSSNAISSFLYIHISNKGVTIFILPIFSRLLIIMWVYLFLLLSSFFLTSVFFNWFFPPSLFHSMSLSRKNILLREELFYVVFLPYRNNIMHLFFEVYKHTSSTQPSDSLDPRLQLSSEKLAEKSEILVHVLHVLVRSLNSHVTFIIILIDSTTAKFPN